MKRDMTETEIVKLEKIAELLKAELPNHRIVTVESDCYSILTPEIYIYIPDSEWEFLRVKITFRKFHKFSAVNLANKIVQSVKTGENITFSYISDINL